MLIYVQNVVVCFISENSTVYVKKHTATGDAALYKKKYDQRLQSSSLSAEMFAIGTWFIGTNDRPTVT